MFIRRSHSLSVVTALLLLLAAGTSNAQVDVLIPDQNVQVGDAIMLPVEVGDATGADLTAYQFDLTFDAAVLDLDGISAAGTLSDGSAPLFNRTGRGAATIAFATATPLTGAGPLLYLTGTVVGVGDAAVMIEALKRFDSDGSELSGAVTTGRVFATGVEVSLPAIAGSAGESITLPITIGEVTDRDVVAYQLTVAYDDAVLDLDGAAAEGTLSDGASLAVNAAQTGRLAVAVASTAPLSGAGTLLNLTGTLVGDGDAALIVRELKLFDSDGDEVVSTAPLLDVQVPAATGEADEAVALGLTIGDVTCQGIVSYDAVVSFDTSLLRLDGLDVSGTLSEGATTSFLVEDGTLSIAVAASAPLEASGELIRLTGAMAADGTTTPTIERLRFFDVDGRQVVGTTCYAATGTAAEAPPPLASSVQLDANYPNPFSTSTTISYTLPAPDRVRLRVYDVLGRIVATLVDAHQPSGRHDASFDARDLPGGLYVYRLETSTHNTHRTMMVAR